MVEAEEERVLVCVQDLCSRKEKRGLGWIFCFFCFFYENDKHENIFLLCSVSS